LYRCHFSYLRDIHGGAEAPSYQAYLFIFVNLNNAVVLDHNCDRPEFDLVDVFDDLIQIAIGDTGPLSIGRLFPSSVCHRHMLSLGTAFRCPTEGKGISHALPLSRFAIVAICVSLSRRRRPDSPFDLKKMKPLGSISGRPVNASHISSKTYMFNMLYILQQFYAPVNMFFCDLVYFFIAVC
jgi:hypothetical protein